MTSEMTEFIEIDGSFGEGGGQILRTSLALSMITGQALRVGKIRAGRKKDGLLNQHLCGLRAATEICSAELEGDELRSTEFSFKPGKIKAGKYKFSVGTAGSTSLVLQTVLPALMMADGESEVIVEGGTHAMAAPSFDFLDRCFFPQLRAMGVGIEAELERYGFYPAGGGRVRVKIQPAKKLKALNLTGRLKSNLGLKAEILDAKFSRAVIDREVEALKASFALEESDILRKEIMNSLGNGNVIQLRAKSELGTEVFTACAKRGKSAESLVDDLLKEFEAYKKSGAFVGEHLADQLLLPMALAGEGSFLCSEWSLHSKTNMAIIERFLAVKFKVEEQGSAWKVSVAL